MIKPSPFNSEERVNFFKKSSLPFWDAFYKIGERKIYYPYALYFCQKESRERLKEIQEASVLIGKVFERVSKQIKKWSLKELKKWNFDIKFYDLIQLDWDEFFCFRAGWGFKDGQLKLMEINSQTPSFWFEPEEGNRVLASHFKLQDPSPNSNQKLRASLNQAIKKNLVPLKHLKKDTSPTVGFIIPDYYDDIELIKWLSSYCEYNFEILTINNLDFTRKGNIPFNRQTQVALDALVFWYPLEWLVDLKFVNGDKFWQVFIDGLKQKSFSLVHALPSFFIQSKAILAYITENEDQIFTGRLKKAKKYFAKTYFSPEKLGKNYIAKPIWGREGRGSFIIKDNQKTYSRYQENYYVKQDKIYQELLNLPKLKLEDKKIHLIYEAWVYRVDGKLVPGAIGIRGSQHLITDDFSYWIPIGV